MAYNTTASLEKLTFPDYVDLARVQTDLDDFPGPEMTPNTWILN